MKLLNFIKRNSYFCIAIVGFLGLSSFIGGAGYFYRLNESKINELSSLRNGLNICGSRVSQTFFASQNSIGKSNALESRFLAQTDQCFSMINESSYVTEKAALSSMSIAAYDEFINFKNLIKNSFSEDVEKSRIIRSYNELEKIKYDFTQTFSSEISELSKLKENLKFSLLAAITLLGVFSVFLIVVWSRWDSKLKEIEDQAKGLIDDYVDNGARIERLMEKIFDHINLPYAKNLLQDYHLKSIGSSNFNEIDKAFSSDSTSVQVYNHIEKYNNDNLKEKNIELAKKVITQEVAPEEKTGQILKKLASSFNKRNHSKLMFRFDKNFKNISFNEEQETFEQLVFEFLKWNLKKSETEDFFSKEIIVSGFFDKQKNYQLNLLSSGNLFSINELEYLNEEQDKIKVSKEIKFIKNLAQDNFSIIEAKNSFGENFTDKSSCLSVLIRKKVLAPKTKTIQRIVTGKKRNLFRKLDRETTV